jgi:5-methylcytosine-specific restriction endonuclease McrA
MGKRQKEWARKSRAKLVAFLGGVCRCCGAAEALEFDHIHPETREWRCCQKSTDVKMTLYWREAKRGYLQLLCEACNKTKGDCPQHFFNFGPPPEMFDTEGSTQQSQLQPQ